MCPAVRNIHVISNPLLWKRSPSWMQTRSWAHAVNITIQHFPPAPSGASLCSIWMMILGFGTLQFGLWDICCPRVRAGSSMPAAHLEEKLLIDSVLVLRVIFSQVGCCYLLIWKTITLRFCLLFSTSMAAFQKERAAFSPASNSTLCWEEAAALGAPPPPYTRHSPGALVSKWRKVTNSWVTWGQISTLNQLTTHTTSLHWIACFTFNIFPFFNVSEQSDSPSLVSSEGWCEQLEVSAICFFFLAHRGHGSIAVR